VCQRAKWSLPDPQAPISLYTKDISKEFMTITERNQKLFELRHKLQMKRTELAWIEQEIMAVRQQYKDAQMGDLYEEMFGN